MRTESALKNSTFAIIQKVIEIVLAFVFRTVLIRTLGNTYLGLSGLFTNIFTLFSLMELGVSSSIIYLIYKPLKEKDTDTIKSLLKLYSRFYNTIAIIIAIIGVCLIPFLPYIIKEYESITINLIPIYLLTLANIVLSYFLAYRRSFLEADQKAYINSFNYSLFNIIGTFLRIVVLLVLKDYNLTLAITLICTVISNLIIYKKTNAMYPFLNDNKVKKISKRLKNELFRRMGASTMHQLGNIVVTSTDNIIISAFIGVGVVGIYSNYSMITNIIYTTFALIFVSITANVGNMKLTESKETSKKVYDKLFFLNFYLYFIACTIFFCLINYFVLLWIGSSYLLDMNVVFVITISLYVMGMRHTVVTFLNSSGLNYNTRYKSIFEVIINLVISIILVKEIGLLGVILGTIISFLVVSVWYEPYILFKHWFKDKVGKYYLKYIVYLSLTIFCMFVLKRFMSVFTFTSIWGLFLEFIIGFVFLNALVVVLFYKTDEFKYYINLIKVYLKKIMRRN